MGKISLVAALLLCLLAFASANTCIDNTDNPPSCQEQMQSQRLNHCRMYLSRNLQYYGDKLGMVTDNDEINPPIEVCRQHCCQELRDIDTRCRCPALLRMVMQEPGTQGQEAEPMLGKARYLPRICNIQPTQCDF